MKELENIRKQLIAKWDLFSKLGGEWNNGYLAASHDAIAIVDDAIDALKREESKNAHPSSMKKDDPVTLWNEKNSKKHNINHNDIDKSLYKMQKNWEFWGKQ
jgi:hypothetical protein